MCLFGTASGMILLVAALGANDSIHYVSEWQFDKLTSYESQASFDDQATLEQKLAFAEKNRGELVEVSAIEVARKKNDKKKQTVTVNVCEGKDIYKLTNRELKQVSIADGEVAITMKLAKSLGVKTGDTIAWHLYDKEEWVTSKVTMINRNPQVVGLTMTKGTYEAAGYSFNPSMCLSKEKELQGASKEIIKASFTKNDIRKVFDNSMSTLAVLVVALITVAIILTVLVLYNSGILSYNERQKELATLKVMGFRTGRIRRLLFQQNLWISIIGVFVGIPFGKLLLQYMFDSNGDTFDYVAIVTLPSYLLSGILVLGTSMLVSVAFSRRLKKLDMVEALKGLE